MKSFRIYIILLAFSNGVICNAVRIEEAKDKLINEEVVRSVADQIGDALLRFELHLINRVERMLKEKHGNPIPQQSYIFGEHLEGDKNTDKIMENVRKAIQYTDMVQNREKAKTSMETYETIDGDREKNLRIS